MRSLIYTKGVGMTKKEKQRFDADVRFLLDHSLIATYDQSLEETIAYIEKTNFSRAVKDAAIQKLKEVRTK